jgi:hypothetical protein
MTIKFLSIQDAADLSKKSVQTLRRAIKAKKLKIKRKKTAQGFNYLVEESSLCALYKIKLDKAPSQKAQATKKKVSVKKNVEAKGKYITTEDFRSFTNVLDKMVTQHNDERQNFMRLVNNMQEKIFTLENQMNLLKEPVAAGDKKWFHFWKA